MPNLAPSNSYPFPKLIYILSPVIFFFKLMVIELQFGTQIWRQLYIPAIHLLSLFLPQALCLPQFILLQQTWRHFIDFNEANTQYFLMNKLDINFSKSDHIRQNFKFLFQSLDEILLIIYKSQIRSGLYQCTILVHRKFSYDFL